MRIPGRLGTPALVATTVALAFVVGGAAPTQARTVDDSKLTPHTSFTMNVNPYDGTVPAPASGADIPNIDSVKSTIRTYYNAAKDAGTGLWVSNKTTSPYITELGGIQQSILADLPATAPANSAVVFDVDATLLADFDFEEAVHYIYDSGVANQWVTDHLYPAVNGMPALVRTLLDRGYDVYGVTGRPTSQQADTIANLTEQGFTATGGGPVFSNANLYTTGFSFGSRAYQASSACTLWTSAGRRSRYQRACQSSSTTMPARLCLASSSRAFATVARLRLRNGLRVSISPASRASRTKICRDSSGNSAP